MIVYLDTSAFLKLYLEEPGTAAVREIVDSADAVCAHLITYAEMCAAFAQALRMRRITAAQQTELKRYFEPDWEAVYVLPVDSPLVRRAGQLAQDFGLRGYDSMHLAAAERVWRQVPENFQFVAFDARLVQAAQALGMPDRSL